MEMLGFNILIEEIKEELVEEKTASGLIVPGTAKKESEFLTAKVVRIGPGDYVFNVFVKPTVAVGNTIVVDKKFVRDFKHDGKEFKLVLLRDVLMTL